MEWVLLIVGIVLFFIFPKQMGALLGLVVLAGVGIFLYSQHQQDLRRQEQDRVVINLSYAVDKGCTNQNPLSVFIGNTGDKTVNKVEWRVEVRRPGYSGDLVDDYFSGSYQSDKIIKPKQGFSFCYQLPKLKPGYNPSELTYRATNKYVTFAE